MRRRLHTPLALFLLGLPSCAVPIQLPKDFLELKGSGFRAVTGDDARVWVREFDDRNEASLEFWCEALVHDLTQQRGYELVGKGDVVAATGEAGRWFECATSVNGELVGYVVAIWPIGRQVTVVEFAARADVFAARKESVKKALATVRL